MAESQQVLDDVVQNEYKYGFESNIEQELLEKGLNEDTVRFISAKKNEPEWMLEWRLKAFRQWEKMTEPKWPNVKYPKVDFQDIIYWAAPKKKETLESLDQVDPELLATFEKLGIPLEEQKMLTGVAVDAVLDSVSVKTTFQEALKKEGVIFMPMSEAIQEHPELVKKYIGSVGTTEARLGPSDPGHPPGRARGCARGLAPRTGRHRGNPKRPSRRDRAGRGCHVARRPH